MSEETQQPQAPAAQPAAPAAVAEKPAAPEPPKEPPFTIDALIQSTTRFTRKAWNIVLSMRNDLNAMKTAPMRFTLEATTAQAAEALQHELVEAGVKEISRNGQVISMSTTFEVLQKVIKRPEVHMVDAIKL